MSSTGSWSYVSAECDCGRTPVAKVPEPPESVAASFVRLVCAGCGETVHATNAGPGTVDV
jgi:hypothetical protein